MVNTQNPYNDITDNLLELFTDKYNDGSLSLGAAPIKGRPLKRPLSELPLLFVYFDESEEDWTELPRTMQVEMYNHIFYLYAREDKGLEETDLGNVTNKLANFLRQNITINSYCIKSSIDEVKRTFREGSGSGIDIRLQSLTKPILVSLESFTDTGCIDTGNPYNDIPDNLVQIFTTEKDDGNIQLNQYPEKSRPMRVLLKNYPALFIYFDSAGEEWAGLPSSLRVNYNTELLYLYAKANREELETDLANAADEIVDVLRANLTLDGYCRTSSLRYVYREERTKWGTGVRIGFESLSKNITDFSI